MQNPTVVNQADWLSARKALLKKEKEFTKLRDQLTQERQALPWVKIEKNYRFLGSAGEESLADLFEGKSQLIVYHFMFGPDWEVGCKSCSFWADNFNNIIVHLRQRDVNMVAISRGPLEKLEAFRKRMGWNFKWLSSADSDFNFDFNVSFQPDQTDTQYNYTANKSSMDELPGISVFSKGENGEIFHTYSCYSRGLDMMNTAYHYLDLVPKGRDEDGLAYSMEWVKLKDLY